MRPETARSQEIFPDPEERDRARSTWAAHSRTCAALATICDAPRVVVAALDYSQEVRRFARAWVASGHSLPPGFDSSDGQPPTPEEATAYQLVRGRGSGQRLASCLVDSELRAGWPQAEPFPLLPATFTDSGDGPSPKAKEAPLSPAPCRPPPAGSCLEVDPPPRSGGISTVDVRLPDGALLHGSCSWHA